MFFSLQTKQNKTTRAKFVKQLLFCVSKKHSNSWERRNEPAQPFHYLRGHAQRASQPGHRQRSSEWEDPCFERGKLWVKFTGHRRATERTAFGKISGDLPRALSALFFRCWSDFRFQDLIPSRANNHMKGEEVTLLELIWGLCQADWENSESLGALSIMLRRVR